MTAPEQILFEKIRQLPMQRITEVEDFVDFLRARDNDQQITLASTKISESSFSAVWNNDEDAAYDAL